MYFENYEIKFIFNSLLLCLLIRAHIWKRKTQSPPASQVAAAAVGTGHFNIIINTLKFQWWEI